MPAGSSKGTTHIEPGMQRDRSFRGARLVEIRGKSGLRAHQRILHDVQMIEAVQIVANPRRDWHCVYASALRKRQHDNPLQVARHTKIGRSVVAYARDAQTVRTVVVLNCKTRYVFAVAVPLKYVFAFFHRADDPLIDHCAVVPEELHNRKTVIGISECNGDRGLIMIESYGEGTVARHATGTYSRENSHLVPWLELKKVTLAAFSQLQRTGSYIAQLRKAVDSAVALAVKTSANSKLADTCVVVVKTFGQKIHVDDAGQLHLGRRHLFDSGTARENRTRSHQREHSERACQQNCPQARMLAFVGGR